MALTAQQLVDVRYFMGLSVTGDTTSAPYRELAYSNVSYMGLSLDYRLAHLSAEEESVLTGYFLKNLALRRQEIQDAAENLDTDKAAVWTRNRSEVSNRKAMYAELRAEMCQFLGFRPGPGLTAGSRVVRG